jgi:hypothetical protein
MELRDVALEERIHGLNLVAGGLHREVVAAVKPVGVPHELKEYAARAVLLATSHPARVRRRYRLLLRRQEHL